MAVLSKAIAAYERMSEDIEAEHRGRYRTRGAGWFPGSAGILPAWTIVVDPQSS